MGSAKIEGILFLEVKTLNARVEGHGNMAIDPSLDRTNKEIYQRMKILLSPCKINRKQNSKKSHVFRTKKIAHSLDTSTQ